MPGISSNLPSSVDYIMNIWTEPTLDTQESEAGEREKKITKIADFQ